MDKMKTLIGGIFLPAILIGCNKTKSLDESVNLSENDSCIIVSPQKFDFGEVKKDTAHMVKFEFKLTNNCDSTIKINNADVSCECVSILEYPDRILPNQTLPIKCEINVKNQLGHIKKNIFINYNESSVIMFKVVGDVLD